MPESKFFKIITVFSITAFFISCHVYSQKGQQQNWTHFIRTAGHGASKDHIDEVFQQVKETHVFGMEIDNSLTGYYESFLHPEEKLKIIKTYVDRAHEAGNKIFVYTEGLEIITSNADEKEHTFYKDHPDWVQRDIKGKPAVFGHNSDAWQQNRRVEILYLGQ